MTAHAHAIPRAACPGKRRYTSPRQAKRATARVHNAITVYFCREHAAFHIRNREKAGAGW